VSFLSTGTDMRVGGYLGQVVELSPKPGAPNEFHRIVVAECLTPGSSPGTAQFMARKLRDQVALTWHQKSDGG